MAQNGNVIQVVANVNKLLKDAGMYVYVAILLIYSNLLLKNTIAWFHMKCVVHVRAKDIG
jgi:hypothetical protein